MLGKILKEDGTMNEGNIPVIDPSVRYVGVSKLRELKAATLRQLKETLVVQDEKQPLAVILSYKQFLNIQSELDRVVATLEFYMTSDGSEIAKAVADANPGKTTSLLEIPRTLTQRKYLNNLVSSTDLEGINELSGKANVEGVEPVHATSAKGSKASE
jgi:hypothetical protein